MAKSIFLAWANPSTPEHEEKFNTWYDDVHVPEVRCAVPAITAVNRYLREVRPDDAGGVPVHSYLAVYELDSDDLDAAALGLNEGIMSGEIVLDPCLDLQTTPPMLGWYRHV